MEQTTLRGGDIWSLNSQTFQLIGMLPVRINSPHGVLDWTVQDLDSGAVFQLNGAKLFVNGRRVRPSFNRVKLHDEKWTIYGAKDGSTVIAVGDLLLDGITSYSLDHEIGPWPIITLRVPVREEIEIKLESTDKERSNEKSDTNTGYPLLVWPLWR